MGFSKWKISKIYFSLYFITQHSLVPKITQSNNCYKGELIEYHFGTDKVFFHWPGAKLRSLATKVDLLPLDHFVIKTKTHQIKC